jgi:hypothetical protein
MKSIVKEQNKSTEIVYPCAFRFIGPDSLKPNVGNLIVLAIGDSEGFVIHSPENCKYELGNYDIRWLDFDDKTEWEPFVGSVELQFP